MDMAVSVCVCLEELIKEICISPLIIHIRRRPFESPSWAARSFNAACRRGIVVYIRLARLPPIFCLFSSRRRHRSGVKMCEQIRPN